MNKKKAFRESHKTSVCFRLNVSTKKGFGQKKTPSLLFVRTKTTLARETPRHYSRRRLGPLVLVLFKEKRKAFCARTVKEESRPYFFFFFLKKKKGKTALFFSFFC